jgi:hypothetical protein
MAVENDTFRFKASLLFLIAPSVWERDTSFGVDDSKPGETLFHRR